MIQGNFEHEDFCLFAKTYHLRRATNTKIFCLCTFF